MSCADISIIIPTRNRAASLTRLLRSLEAMEIPPAARVEALVVDNGSTDETARMAGGWPSRVERLSVRALSEPKVGKANALNCGLAAAHGEPILAVDDDVVVDRNWLVAHLDCLQSATFDAVQGRVLPGVDPAGRPAESERLQEYNIPIVDYGEQVRAVRGLTGTNVALRRKVVEAVGRFDPRLGPGASGFSEDTEYSIRIRQAGFSIGYAPRAVVYHELDPRRYGRTYNRQIQFRKGVSRAIYRRDSLLLHVLPNLLASCVRLAIYRALGKSGKVYRTEGRVMRNWGFLVGKLKFSERAGSKEQR